ncbi:dimethyl sulfoxide reductase anchor subunit family protein [Salipaludibacillus daqingensis]|uniref:dimethyl sulfoxide reductase anchor subunit family protein n=1 Tax=Salipaludibacillus daqingensis TaxID=3041001 RepID=UPI002473B5B6|nr:DmsC/YnfH family molybdoenzyme membrane anchor subunit [Salipaludibacillus daqingensis]
MHELPLVIFTVFSQIAVGAMVTLWIIDLKGGVTSNKIGKGLSISIFVIALVAILSSVFHLGQPLEAFRALVNVQTSWLTREIWLFSLMLLTMIGYIFTWSKKYENKRKIVGGVSSLFGLIAVMGSAMIYVLPAMPAWNNFSPIFFFVMTGVLLGPLYVSVVLYFFDKESMNIWKVAPLMALVYAMSSFFYITVLLSGTGTLETTANNIMSHPMFVYRGVFSWIIPAVVLLPFFFFKVKRKPAFMLLAIVFTIAFAGEIIGREIFYNTIVELDINQVD